MAEFKSEAQN